MINRLFACFVSALLVVSSASTAWAQLLAAKDAPIAYGHHHLNITNLEEHKKFWVAALGGTAISKAGRDIVKFPNVLMFLRVQKPTGGTKGTSVNHIGFAVPNLRAAVDKIKANGFKMVTSTEANPTYPIKDDIAVIPDRNVGIAFAMGPDDVKVELVEVKDQKVPITLHHVHFFGQQNNEMQAWYVKVFGATPRSGGNFPSADLPGVALNFSPSPDPVVGIQGRSLDHIGFEVKNLAEFIKKLEGQGIKLSQPYRNIPEMEVNIAFITDPWGSYIELTEGLVKIS